MVKLSIVYVARDDRYGDDYNCVEFPEKRSSEEFYKQFTIKFNNIQRIKFAIENNIKLLDKFFANDYEIIFIDWNPINEQFLYVNNELKQLFAHNNIKNIIVSKKSIEKYGLNPNGFYEYFGKNVGIKNCCGEYILISNPDDVISDELMKNIKNNITNNDVADKVYYRCYSRFDVDHDLKIIDEGLSFGKPGNNVFADYYLGTPASGDFLLTKKNYLNNATGYDETHISTGNQTMLDGKLCYRLHYCNIIPKCINGSIMHLDHKKHNRSGVPLNWRSDYINNDGWGFNDYSIVHLQDNIYKI